jgi:flagellin-specific chaperone FliS
MYYSSQSKTKVDPYLSQKVMSASKEQLISYIYDAAITACAREDRERAGKAINGLISALNFDYKEQAVVFFQVYRYLNRLVMQGNFSQAKGYLSELKDTWSKAMKVV